MFAVVTMYQAPINTAKLALLTVCAQQPGAHLPGASASPEVGKKLELVSSALPWASQAWKH